MRKYNVSQRDGRYHLHWQERHASGRIVPATPMLAPPDDPTAFVWQAVHGMPLAIVGDFLAWLDIEGDFSLRQFARPAIDAFVCGWAAAYLNDRRGQEQTPADATQAEGNI